MQIVIDIPEEVKHKVYAYGLSLCPSDKEQLIHAIMNGTPLTDTLDKIRAEIEQGYCEVEDDYDRGRNMGLYIAMQIIDHYKAESEDKDADKKCTYKETGCGSCKRQLDCPIEADTAESEVKK